MTSDSGEDNKHDDEGDNDEDDKENNLCYFHTLSDCAYPDYQCEDGISCVLKEELCDGQTQCPDGDDEHDCPSKMSGVSRSGVSSGVYHVLTYQQVGCITY